jgi:alpha-L-rhamnosidase
LEDGTISGTGMNSLNHYANGTVAEGIYTRIMGLRILKPGFKKVLIKPHLNWRMRKADFCFNSPAGKYQIAFDIRSDQTVAFDITVPYGATAALELPDREKEIAEGGTHHIEYKLKKDIIHPFGINTPIIELFKNPKTADIIKSSQLLSWVAGNDEYNGASIYQVTQIKAFPITSQEVDDIVGRLNKIEG